MLNIKTLVKTVAIFFLALTLSHCATSPKGLGWNNAVELVSSGVVSIQIDVPISFDGTSNRSTYATGFIVDAKRGIILTNRHVVTPGPVTAKAILINNEEIDLTPLYIDPVHDFGFYTYQPSDIKHIKPHEFTLNAQSAHVGQEIRIIGNDAGQKISILDGTISRLDRTAPNYGSGRYNDFNTFYIQATTASTGGSSGSPVINIKGEVVALNAGSRSRSSTAFYLPLDRIQVALNYLRQQQPIPRGTLQTTFISTTYTELKRLGLTDSIEAEHRKIAPEAPGLLVVKSIIPSSSAANKLEVGDILLSINQQPIINFLTLENILNRHTHKKVQLSILRQGQPLLLDIHVDDLQLLSPKSYVKFNNNIFHNLSYLQARHYNKPISGVYVAQTAENFYRAGIKSHSVITQFNGDKINNIEEFIAHLAKIPNGEKIHLRFFNLHDPKTTHYALVEINRKWFESSACQQQLSLGYWTCESLENPEKDALLTTSTPPKSSRTKPTKIEDALVQVSYTSPYAIQGRSGNNSQHGTGLIVDIDKGWVVVDRSVIFSMLGDVKLTFNNRLEVTGKVEYIHPLHNLSLVSYPVNELKNIHVSAAVISKQPLSRGDAVIQVGLNYDGEAERRSTFVDTIQELWLSEYNIPQYIDRNLDAINLIDANASIDGVLVNAKDEVTAFWSTFDESENNGKESSWVSAGIPAEYIIELIKFANENKSLHIIDARLTHIAPVKALQRGLSQDWLTKIMNVNPKSQKLLAVYSVANSAGTEALLKRGDILLAINGTPVSSFRQVEKLTQASELNVTYFREGKVYTHKLETTLLKGQDIDRLLFWSGLYLHAPHRAVQQQRGISADGIYIASYQYGSPAARYKVYAMSKIVAIDGTPVNNLDEFISAVKGKQHKESVLIKILDINNRPHVITLRIDSHYWPFYELRYQNEAWEKLDYAQ